MCHAIAKPYLHAIENIKICKIFNEDCKLLKKRITDNRQRKTCKNEISYFLLDNLNYDFRSVCRTFEE